MGARHSLPSFFPGKTPLVKLGTSFFVGVAVGVISVILVDRARKMIREEDVEALKERIAEGLKGLESSVSDLAEGLTSTLAEALE